MAALRTSSSGQALGEQITYDREHLIPFLQKLQEQDGYLSEEAVRGLAASMGMSDSEVYGVATFYAHFRFVPPAERTIRVCEGTACHVAGGYQILRDFEERLEVEAGGITADGRVGLERVACVGCCALAPVVVVDGEVRARMQPKTVRRLISQLRTKADTKT